MAVHNLENGLVHVLTVGLPFYYGFGGLTASADACYRSISPNRGALSSKLAARYCCYRSTGQTDGWTEERTLERFIDPAPHTMQAVSTNR